MSDNGFVDYYEVLQVSSNADTETIERVFRHLAKRYHPDNPNTGDPAQFRVLVDAHQMLYDPERRAAYDAHYQQVRAEEWSLLEEAAAGDVYVHDKELRDRLLPETAGETGPRRIARAAGDDGGGA